MSAQDQPGEAVPAPAAAATTAAPAPAGPAAQPFGVRIVVGVLGLLVAAFMSGFNNRVTALALVDLRGGLGLGTDEGQWVVTVYSAAELVVMPLAGWFAVTFTFRFFHIAMVAGFTLLAFLMPFAPSYAWLLAMRAAQSFMGGALIPLLIMGALRYFPLNYRLYGLSLYALTATFTPNFALWVTPLWTDQFNSLRLLHWQVLPMSVFAIGAVWWGIPPEPAKLDRLPRIDWIGLVAGSSALAMVTIALIEGERRDWLHSPLITWLFGGGAGLFLIFVISEWYHPIPFIKLQLLARRNLWLSFVIFMGLLVIFLSGSLLSVDQLLHVQGFRLLQVAPVGLDIGLPQLVLAPLMAFILYHKWVDARRTFALGLFLIATSCWAGAYVTTAWMAREFAVVQALQAIGQPMAVMSLLLLITGVVQPTEGQFVAGLVNVLRTFASLLGSTLVANLLIDRIAAQQRGLVDRLGRIEPDSGINIAALAGRIGQQAFTLAIADAYLVLGVVALLLIPATFLLNYIPPPGTARNPA